MHNQRRGCGLDGGAQNLKLDGSQNVMHSLEQKKQYLEWKCFQMTICFLVIDPRVPWARWAEPPRRGAGGARAGRRPGGTPPPSRSPSATGPPPPGRPVPRPTGQQRGPGRTRSLQFLNPLLADFPSTGSWSQPPRRARKRRPTARASRMTVRHTGNSPSTREEDKFSPLRTKREAD